MSTNCFAATFGNTAYDAGVYDEVQSPYIYCSPFTLTEDGTISKFTARVQASSTTKVFKILVFSQSGSEPSVLKAVSDEATSTTTEAWVDAPLTTPVALTSGVYYLCLIAGANNVRIIYDAIGGGIYKRSVGNNYATPVDWTDTDMTDTNYNVSIYATYEATEEEAPEAESWTPTMMILSP